MSNAQAGLGFTELELTGVGEKSAWSSNCTRVYSVMYKMSFVVHASRKWISGETGSSLISLQH